MPVANYRLLHAIFLQIGRYQSDLQGYSEVSNKLNSNTSTYSFITDFRVETWPWPKPLG